MLDFLLTPICLGLFLIDHGHQVLALLLFLAHLGFGDFQFLRHLFYLGLCLFQLAQAVPQLVGAVPDLFLFAFQQVHEACNYV